MAIEETAPPRLAGLGAATAAVIAWGIGPVLVKFIDLPGLAVAFDRLLLGTFVWVGALYLRGGRLSRGALRACVPGGAAFGLNIVLFFIAVKRTTVTDATVIGALQPALVLMLVGPMFAERVTPKDLAWSTLALGGVVTVVAGAGRASNGDVGGDLLAVGALLAWAAYFVASKQARRHLGALEYQAGLGIVAFLVVAPLALAVRVDPVPGDPEILVWLVIIVLGPGGGHLLMNWAHAHLRLSVASLLTLASPVISALGAAVALDEPLLGVQVVGMAVVVGALAVVVYRMSIGQTAVADDLPLVDPERA